MRVPTDGAVAEVGGKRQLGDRDRDDEMHRFAEALGRERSGLDLLRSHLLKIGFLVRPDGRLCFERDEL